MIDLTDGVKRYFDTVESVGKLAVSTLFPSEFEYYMVAFELCDGQTGRTIDYFSFPILPSSYHQSEKSIVSIKKTFGGVSVLSSPQFVPIPISLQGNFGKTFKVILKNNSVLDFIGLSMSSDIQSVDDGYLVRNYVMGENRQLGKVTQSRIFLATLKTGYGCLKILKAICNKSQDRSQDGTPHKLYFYNMALGESYIVKINSIDTDQSVGSRNSIWEYNLQMTAVLPVEFDYFRDKNETGSGSLTESLASGVIQKSLNSFANSVVNNFTKTSSLLR